jgi:hypothetical protein
MIFKRHPIYYAMAVLACTVASGGVLAQAPGTTALVGQWRFETVIGTSSHNGVVSDDIGTGLLTITQSPGGLAATISWLDAQGRVTSARQADGRVDGAGAVFTHRGSRTSTGRNGSTVSQEVTVRWTLRAIGDRIVGVRLVETDEDEPKPVTGARVAASDARPASALAPAPSAAPPTTPAGRGPSTADERARVLRIAREGQHDPRRVAQREAAWLSGWIDDIPDLSLEYGTVYDWVSGAAAPAIRDVLRFQYAASAMALQIDQPGLAGHQDAIDGAALTGVLEAYETLVHADGALASSGLDRALAARKQGKLADFLGALAGRDPIRASLGRTASSDPQVRKMVALAGAKPRVMEWLDILSNRFGGRMTGSDAYTHAAAWSAAQLKQWGLQAGLEEAGQVALGFNRGPWFARMVAPVAQPLRIATPAYTAGTRGVQRGLVAIGPVTLEEARRRGGEFKDKWVLIGGLSSGSGRDGEYRHQPRAIMLALGAAGALGTIQAAEEPLLSGAAAPTSWEALPTLPDIKLAQSQYGAIRQRVMSGEAVTLEFDIRNWFYPGPVTYHNVVASIPGSDKAGEIVLLGAHLDSFDGASGAADNGAGVATMMEAMRLLAAAGVKPRRTIMLVAFSGEENGLKGSSAFAERHAAQLPGVVMMLNRDARPGAISGLTIPSAWHGVFQQVEQDLADVHPIFGFTAIVDNKGRERGGAAGRASSDDSVFALRDVPAPRFSALTDFDYARVHHTQADTYENVLPFRAAQQYSALAIALIAYEVANAEQDISRAKYYR